MSRPRRLLSQRPPTSNIHHPQRRAQTLAAGAPQHPTSRRIARYDAKGTQTPHDTNIHLLRIQASLSLDARGRIANVCGMRFAVAEDGHACWIGADVPDRLAAELTRLAANAPAPRTAAAPPPALDACQQLLEADVGRRIVRQSGPSYVFEGTPPVPAAPHIERSDAANPAALRDANPGNWEPDEWQDLLAGRLGPWAMATHGGAVLSIAHTPLPVSALAAECGVWTRPDARGQGYAAAVTAAWSAIVRREGRRLFYSTTQENRSSQRVAERLRLRPIGATWRLRAAG